MSNVFEKLNKKINLFQVHSKGIFKTINEFKFTPQLTGQLPNLGSGSFGKVKLYQNIKNNIFYAIKIVN